MDWKSIAFDWNQVRGFLVTAEEGSLSGAARALGLTQPTLSRQVAALEAQLGVTVFERAGRALVLTEAGRVLLEHVREMGAAAQRVSLDASGQAHGVTGRVCMSVTEVAAVYLLPPILTRLREIAPGLAIEIRATAALSDLQRREADIALRHVRPEQPDLVARRLPDDWAHLYASGDWIARKGATADTGALNHTDFVGFGQDPMLREALNAQGLSLSEENFPIGSSNQLVAWEMVRRGLGIGVMTARIAAQTPGVIRIAPFFPPIAVQNWLAVHREVNTSRRVRLVFDALAEALS